MSTKNVRNDDHLQKKWNAPRVLYSDLNPYPDPGLDCSVEPSLTDQSQAEACDINFILKRYQQTGVAPGVNAEALYADVSESGDYHSAMNILNQANAQFEALDAHTRARFGNDPAQFLDFMHDPKNLPEMIKLKLVTQRSPDAMERLVDEMKGLREDFKSPPSEPSSPSAVVGRGAKRQKDS